MKNVMDANASTQRLVAKAILLADGQAIKEIHALLGELTGVRPKDIQAAFQHERTNTLADAARLHIRTEPGRGISLTCCQESSLRTKDDACPVCGSRRIHLVAGHVLHLASLTFHGHRLKRDKPARRAFSQAQVRIPAKAEADYGR
jgi:hydrogenase nickel incorporation protein HypA/HybF